MTLDGFCNHEAGIPDEELHDHFTKLLNDSGAMLYGRITYQLMEEYWPNLVKHPSGERSMDEFAVAIENIQKIVFSHTLKNVTWENTVLADKSLEEEVAMLKQQEGKDVLVGSPGLIAALHKLKLIDEYQLCIHPVVIGKGLPLFRDVNERTVLKLLKTKTFGSGVMLMYYKRAE